MDNANDRRDHGRYGKPATGAPTPGRAFATALLTAPLLWCRRYGRRFERRFNRWNPRHDPR
ncbi:hypothetical protein [Castellaniella sp.]|uniref:hypothetical protein n=1 Tax=Castellaniella sp. TaxID=1955812 RepID=UPI002AFFEDE1|nr:hypothetical protein [Castellaniella sp.]